MATINPEWEAQMQRNLDTGNALRQRQAQWNPRPTAAPTVSPMPDSPSRLSKAATSLRSGADNLRKVANGTAGKLLGGAAAAGAILDSAEPDSTARYAQRFGVSEPTGDGSIGDIAKFSLLRAGGFASDLGNNLTLGLAGNFFRDRDMPRNQAAPTAEQPVTTNPSALPSPTRSVDTLAGASGRVVDENGGNALVALRRPGQSTEYTSASDMMYGKPLSRGNVSVYGTGDQPQLQAVQNSSRDSTPAAAAPDVSARADEVNANYDRLSAPLLRGLSNGKLTAAGMRSLQALESDRARSLDNMDENRTRQYGAELGFRAAQEQAKVASEDRALAREDRLAIAGQAALDRKALRDAAAAKDSRENLNSMVDDLSSEPVLDKDGNVKSYVVNPSKKAQVAKITEQLQASGQPVNRQTVQMALDANAPIENMRKIARANGLPESSALVQPEFQDNIGLADVVRGKNSISLRDYIGSFFEPEGSLDNTVVINPKTGARSTGRQVFENDQDAYDLYRKGK
jgi:hypothetical protein